MPTRNTPTSTARLVADIAAASPEVMTHRMIGLSDPRAFMSPVQLRDLSGMASEKFQAGMHGWFAGSLALWMLPARLAMTMLSATVAPTGSTKAIDQAGQLWLGVANATLAPVRAKVVANRASLRKRRGRR